jgi:hypothetical protein
LRVSAVLPPGIVLKLAETPGFVTNGGEIRRETDCLLEGTGFELLVPGEISVEIELSLLALCVIISLITEA